MKYIFIILLFILPGTASTQPCHLEKRGPKLFIYSKRTNPPGPNDRIPTQDHQLYFRKANGDTTSLIAGFTLSLTAHHHFNKAIDSYNH